MMIKLWFFTLLTSYQSKHYLSLIAKFTHPKSAIKCGSQSVCRYRYLIIIIILAREEPLSLLLSVCIQAIHITKD